MRQRDFTRVLPLLFVLTGAVSLFTFTAGADEKVRRISVDDYRDKMAGGWLGQMIGVGWGEPT
ncbi:MAG: hypothetical protein GY809_14585, partial [Planctomycetes bacterium]|nr:hypothetical protein [Planctomycetota bacterium]